MRIVIVNGSPKGANGNTQVLVNEFVRGAESAGAVCETLFLSEKKIEPCRGCFTCWLKTPGHCAIQDDVAGMLSRIEGSDLLVFATPLYVDNVTGLMKNFMDRMIPVADPHFEKDPAGECRHFVPGVKVPKIGVISNSGFPEQSHFQVLRLLFFRIARNMNTEVVVEIYRGGGAILKDSALPMRMLLRGYKARVRQAGEEVVRFGRISKELQEELEKPLMPDEVYIREGNKYFERILNSNTRALAPRG